ncbi:MAG: tetratricopeptide repeat protein [Dehalococcoidia bacterium]
MTFEVEEISPRRRASEEAIAMALESRWEEAVEANQAYLQLYPNDTEGLNRLGKALMELGRYDDARDSYQKSLELDTVANIIARKNLQRLEGLSQGDGAPRPEGSPKIAAQLFIEETGKSGIAPLLDVNEDTLKLLAPGDSVELQVEGKKLLAMDAGKGVIGEVDPKVGLRLLPLIDSGNTYAAALHSIDGETARIIIRETFQAEANLGKLSFPAGQADASRAYTRESLVRTDEDDDELEDTAEDWVDTEATDVDEDHDSFVEAPRIKETTLDEEEFET